MHAQSTSKRDQASEFMIQARDALTYARLGSVGIRERPCPIKLDRVLVQRIDTDHRKRSIVANTVQLAHQLNVQVIATGT